MKLTLYQVDAFAEKAFEGNPACVIPLKAWLPDSTMQAIAEENNVSETAFFVPTSLGFHIRWFTPQSEVKLCGHATIASAFVLFNEQQYPNDIIHFESLSGILSVSKTGNVFTLNLPSQIPEPCPLPEPLIDSLGQRPIACLSNVDIIAVFDNEQTVIDMTPDFSLLKKINYRGIIITAASNHYDFVARFFAPAVGILEDPVTGSAYTKLIPYWAKELNKTRMTAKQVSTRGGKLLCELQGDRVLISGSAIKYMQGAIDI